MKIGSRLQLIITERFAGFADPAGIIRYPSSSTGVTRTEVRGSTNRNTFGVTRDVRSDEAQVVIPGLTEEAGLWVRPAGSHERMDAAARVDICSTGARVGTSQ
jgi:hypothetical protein